MPMVSTILAAGSSSVKGAVNPADISGLARHYDASQEALGTLPTWTDRSVNAAHLSHPTPANQPSVVEVSGKKAVRFNGTSQFLYNSVPFMYAAGACTVFVVLKAAAHNGGTVLGESNTGSNNPAYLISSGTTASTYDNFRTYVRNDAGAASDLSSAFSEPFDGAVGVAVHRDTGSAVTYLDNGIADNDRTYTRSGVVTLNTFSVGAFRRGTVSGYFNGDIYEIIIYNRALTEAEINRVGWYLSAKYGSVWSNLPSLVSAANLPDGAGGDTGKGFTCTGLAYDPTTDSFWAGNDGRNVEGDTSHVPSLVNLSKDGSTKLDEILLLSAFPSAQSIQGVAYDTSDDTLWFASFSEGVVRHISKAGADLGSITPSFTPNGIAYNPSSDSLYIMSDTGVMEERSCSAGTLMNSWTITGTVTPDHLFYEAPDKLWVIYGANGTNGRMFPFNPLTGTYDVRGLRLQGADAVEGAVKLGNEIYVLNDAYFHSGNPALNRLLKYAA